MKTQWQEATAKNTIQGYEGFLSQYPNSQYTATARDQIENLRWQEVTAKNTIPGYEGFLKQYPNSQYTAKARDQIENLRWQEATGKNTIPSYEEFLGQYPKSHFAAKAGEQVDTLRWQEATAKASLPALEDYLSYYPNGTHSSEARKQIEELEWVRANSNNTESGYEAFLKKYPNGSFAAQARKELQTFAKVVVDFPDRLKSRKSYYNIPGPVWVFRIVFRETNGVPVTMESMLMRILAKDMTTWGDWDYEDIFDSERQDNVKIKIPARGTGSYVSWVNSQDCEFCGGTLYLYYTGTDASGHTIHASTSFLLEK